MSSSEYFFSYSRKDLGFVQKLKSDLERNGIKAWLDVDKLRLGDDWAAEIQRALEASKCILLVLSKTSTSSDNVLDEMSYALDNRKLIIPLKIDACIVPLRLARLQRVDFSVTEYESGLSQLLRAIKPSAGDVEDESKKVTIEQPVPVERPIPGKVVTEPPGTTTSKNTAL